MQISFYEPGFVLLSSLLRRTLVRHNTSAKEWYISKKAATIFQFQNGNELGKFHQTIKSIKK